jgi:hypothetical protein
VQLWCWAKTILLSQIDMFWLSFIQFYSADHTSWAPLEMWLLYTPIWIHQFGCNGNDNQPPPPFPSSLIENFIARVNQHPPAHQPLDTCYNLRSWMNLNWVNIWFPRANPRQEVGGIYR